MTKKQREALERAAPNSIGKSVTFKHKGADERYRVGSIEDVVWVVTSDYNHMIQRIKLSPDTALAWGVRHAYRTCYYTLTRKTRTVAWGQYHALVSEAVYRRLARKANAKGWLGLSKA